MCAIEIYGQAVNCIPEEIAEVFAITATFAPYIRIYQNHKIEMRVLFHPRDQMVGVKI